LRAAWAQPLEILRRPLATASEKGARAAELRESRDPHRGPRYAVATPSPHEVDFAVLERLLMLDDWEKSVEEPAEPPSGATSLLAESKHMQANQARVFGPEPSSEDK